jgi:DNA-binding LacI/PurR family transcriptional regulator
MIQMARTADFEIRYEQIQQQCKTYNITSKIIKCELSPDNQESIAFARELALKGVHYALLISGNETNMSELYQHFLSIENVNQHKPPLYAFSLGTNLKKLVHPSIHSIDLHYSDIGAAAAELLLWRMKNPNKRQRRYLIQPSLE